MENKTVLNDFEKEVREGLTAFPKYLSSKYIYDKKGDKLFQEIMKMPSYYLTNCELDILSEHKQKIAKEIADDSEFDLIELGAGDGEKTKILLHELVEKDYEFTYKPVDISKNVLQILENKLKREIPHLKVEPEEGEYFEILNRFKVLSQRRKVILFLGSNIGNLLHEKAIDFLTQLKETMNQGDLLFIGFDQKKDPQIILNAYNDKGGITEAFNRNILYRINREMDGNFDPNQFLHWEMYNPETGTANSFLVAKKEMDVTINSLNIEVHFDQWETIKVEISQKYTDAVVDWIAKEAGLEIINSFSDRKKYYKNYLLQ